MSNQFTGKRGRERKKELFSSIKERFPDKHRLAKPAVLGPMVNALHVTGDGGSLVV